MRFLYDNKFDDYTVTGSTAATNYPATAIQDYQLEKKWRTTTAATSTITIDVGSGLTITPTAGAILNHNFTTSVLAYVEASSDNFSSVSSIATIEHTAGEAATWPLIAYDVSGTYRYWRFRIVDSGVSDGYHEMGRLFLGTYLDWSRGMAIAFPYTIKDTSTIQFTRSGQSYGNTGHNYETFELAFPFISEANRVSIASMYNTVHRTKPLIFIPDENSTNIEPIYGVIDDCTFSHLYNYNWNGSLSFREVK